jgi:hypothetical protein
MILATATTSSQDIATGIARGFNRLFSLLTKTASDYADKRLELLDAVLNSDELLTFLVVNNEHHGVPRVSLLHSITRYSDGWEGQDPLNGKLLGLLGEVIGNQLPSLIKFSTADKKTLLAGLAARNVKIPTHEAVEAFAQDPTHPDLMSLALPGTGKDPLGQSGTSTEL